MRKRSWSLCLAVFVLSLGVLAFAQHGRGGGTGGGMGSGMGSGNMGSGNMGSGNMGSGHDSMGHGGSMDRGNGNDATGEGRMSQQPLNDHQVNGGAFRMLEQKFNLSAQQLQDLYKSSGARNFGQFVSAMVVSKNLGLDYNKVLAGLKTASLGQTLQDLGVSKDKAKSEIKRANQEIKDQEKS